MSEITTNFEEANNDLSQAIVKEINQQNAHEAEDFQAEKQAEILMLDYEAMPLEQLVSEFKKLLSEHKVQAIKKHADAIKIAFDQKYNLFLEEKKEEFIADGGQPYEFSYESPLHKSFYALFSQYRNKKNEYHAELAKIHAENLEKRLQIIEELKNLINFEESVGTTFKQFQQLQERWRKAGAVSYAHYEDLHNTYQHHTERFYDFIELSRDLRDLDFKRNLEEKQKLLQKATYLLENEADTLKAFRELQLLHKIWKEEIGPVAPEFREEIWQQFSEISKKINQKRELYFQHLDQIHKQNASARREIIAQLDDFCQKEITTHNQWQKTMKAATELREKFLQTGRVPQEETDEIWDSFRNVIRKFNKKRNEFYKHIKKEQNENLERKLALLATAKEHKDSENFEEITPLMKKIQQEWNQIGAVPKKNADAILKEFKQACNHYFDRLHANLRQNERKEQQVVQHKKSLLDDLKSYQVGDDKKAELKKLQEFVNQWVSLGKLPVSLRSLDIKFNKIIDALYKKLGFDKQELDLLKYQHRLESITDDPEALQNEVFFVRKKIDELSAEILQLENNLLFFNNLDKESPILKTALKNIEAKKQTKETWVNKLDELKKL